MFQLSRSQIEELISVDDAAVQAVRDAYMAISDGRANLPPVGHIAFPGARGDCHVKYGHIAGDEVFAVKVAAGFYDNPALGLPSSTGVVLVFSARTGQIQALLNDEGYLTDLRTGLGGAIASFALCRPDARRFAIVGSGTQAYWLARAIGHLAPGPVEIALWGRNPDRARALAARLARAGTAVEVEPELEAACRRADVIVTVTPAAAPLVRAEWVRPGCHVTALGADSPGKQELETALVAQADRRVSDMLSQSLDHGEFATARAAGLIAARDCVELGAVLSGAAPGRRRPQDITIADLTGVATQDIAMARAVLARAQAKEGQS
ncbi:MAG: NAD(P)-binding domain-containing protein [Paracoccus sp. (in: a-proteobacteria)]|uniref:ornithine cyclodeaminase family protein n=1 Tax=Paracoccus sp. TaxID=267 RepID=UPI0039E2BDC4